MKKIVLLAFGCLFLASCGPRRLGCGPYRRCEVKAPTTGHSEINKAQFS
jgi:hypothetical protein